MEPTASIMLGKYSLCSKACSQGQGWPTTALRFHQHVYWGLACLFFKVAFIKVKKLLSVLLCVLEGIGVWTQDLEFESHPHLFLL
jgi:hypothetical protein